MDLRGVLRATEDLLYEVIIWLVLIPKTLYRAARDPGWIPAYIQGEWEKPQEERFDAYVSPLILYVVVAVLPNLLAYSLFPDAHYAPRLAPNFLERAGVTLEGLAGEDRLLSYSVNWLLSPFAFALVHQLTAGGPLNSSTMKPVFLVQCMRIAPITLLYPATFVVSQALGPSARLDSTLFLVVVAVGGPWVVLSEVVILRVELGLTRGRALATALCGLILATALSVAWFGLLAVADVVGQGRSG